MKSVLAAFVFAIGTTVLASAQTLSAAEILAMVDEEVGGLAQYRALLNDPDPTRSMAAMGIMMKSNDPTLQRMALDFGLFSPNPQIRRAALDAYFDSGPVLELTFDGKQIERLQYYEATIINSGGTVSTELVGFLPLRVGAFDQENICYAGVGEEPTCFVRVSDAGVSINLWDTWWNLTLNDEGVLAGSGTVYRAGGPGPLTIPVVK